MSENNEAERQLGLLVLTSLPVFWMAYVIQSLLLAAFAGFVLSYGIRTVLNRP